MKGISHFAAGVAVASCFPAAVEQGAAGNPLPFLLGGVFGLLPDTFDFKFYKFLYGYDREVAPDPKKKDARMIAGALADAINNAMATGKAVTIKLDTIRLAADLWQSYEVCFDVAARKVVVAYGPVVDTGGNPVDGYDEEKKCEASARTSTDIRLDYEATMKIQGFDGPVLRMEPQENGLVLVSFIPWHREWSHSVTAAVILGLAGCLILDWMSGCIIGLAYLMHVMLDQLGIMGSNLFYPFQRSRTPGFKMGHSGETWPNLAAVWMSCLIIFWNLYASSGLSVTSLNPLSLALWGALIPMGLYFWLRRVSAVPAK